MRALISLCLVFYLVVTGIVVAQDGDTGLPRVGTYLGYSVIEGQNVKIPTSLEILKYAPEGETRTKLLAFLKLMLGGFKTHEYITQYFVVDNYDWQNPAIALDANSSGNRGDISLDNGMVLEEGRVIKGTISSMRGGFVRGNIHLVLFQNEGSLKDVYQIYPNVPVTPSVTGSYDGACKWKDFAINRLQLEAVKMESSVQRSPFALAGYQIYGRVGMVDPVPRQEGPLVSDEVVLLGFDNAVYEFYQRKLRLPSIGKTCVVSTAAVECGSECSFVRKENEHSLARLLIASDYLRPQRRRHVASVTAGEPLSHPFVDGEIAGNYYGYLHLEQRDQYELMFVSVNLVGPPLGVASGLSRPKISVRTKIVTDGSDLDSPTFLGFLYEPTLFPVKPFKGLMVMGSSDSIMRITNWNKQGIVGELYSKSFGRVGSFELVRGEITKAVSTDFGPPAKSLAGSYMEAAPRDSEMRVKIDIVLTPGIDGPEYYPYEIGGRAAYTFSYTKSPVVDHFDLGSCDPFTGVFSLMITERLSVVTGVLKDDGIYAFFSSSDTAFCDLWPQQWQYYQRKE